MKKNKPYILLADDDPDDCIFFMDALEDLSLDVNLTIVNDGIELMHYLSTSPKFLPDVVFLDLNMPRKSGFECLTDIRQIKEFKLLPIVIFSTSQDTEVVKLLYSKGANFYVRKPGEFSNLKKVISKAITLITQSPKAQATQDNFVLQP